MCSVVLFAHKTFGIVHLEASTKVENEIVASLILARAAQESLLVVLEGFVCSTSCFSVMILLLIQGKNSDKIKIRW